MHSGTEPTDSRIERGGVRSIILRPKVSYQIGSVNGVRRFGVLLTCLLT